MANKTIVRSKRVKEIKQVANYSLYIYLVISSTAVRSQQNRINKHNSETVCLYWNLYFTRQDKHAGHVERFTIYTIKQ